MPRPQEGASVDGVTREAPMKRTYARRRPAGHISLQRASRLYRLVALLGERPLERESLLTSLGVGLRTFYRELDLLRRCGVKVQRVERSYNLKASTGEAQGRLPFPDPQLSFAEMIELARQEGEAAGRLAALLDSVINPTPPKPKRAKKKKGRVTSK
jgi:predicted DNA-binding transcriptional regulator YafY